MLALRAYGADSLLLPAALLIACAGEPKLSARDAADANDTGRVLTPTNENERRLLRELPALPSGKAQRVGDTNVVAEEPYASASGKSCRALQVTSGPTRPASHRLACTDGKVWFFVPDIFGGDAAAE